MGSNQRGDLRKKYLLTLLTAGFVKLILCIEYRITQLLARIEKEKESLKSQIDPECGYIHQARKKGLGYLTEMTVDTSHGIITGVDCYPANQRESDIILEHLKGQPCKSGTL